MKCEVCGGKGWTSNKAGNVQIVSQQWVSPCSLCNGAGQVSWFGVAQQLDESPDTLARVRQGRSKPETCARVLDKVCKLLWPKGQQEMFT